MVARIDLERLAKLRRVLDASKHLPEAHGAPITLWDSADVAELMPLIGQPITNLELEPTAATVVMLSWKRRQHDPHTFTRITPAEADAFAFHESHAAMTPTQAVLHRSAALASDDGTAQMGEFTLTPEQIGRASIGAFVPDYFVWADGHLAVFGQGQHKGEDGRWMLAEIAFTGRPWQSETMRVIAADAGAGPVAEEIERAMADEGVWTWASSLAQNLLWCVSHPDQFPITIERADQQPIRRDHARAARKAGLDLAGVRVVELRPHRVVTVGGPGTGQRREYRYSFPVRGHWRHYANGDAVWVAGYWKAVDRPRLEQMTVERF